MSNGNPIHPDVTNWTPEKLGAEYQKLVKEHDVLQRRINKMTVNALSPESRLNGYRAVTQKLRDRIKELVNDLANFETKALKHFGWMTTHMKWREDQINQNIEEGSQGGYSEELSGAIEFLEELKGE
jgi:hypothetical protein